MPNISDYKKSLKELKDETYALYFQSGEIKDYEKLIQLENIDKKLHEVLLVIHSNYITSMKEANLRSFKIVNKVLDSLIELSSSVEKLEDKCKQEEEKKNSGWITPMNMVKLAVPVVGVVFAFWLMHYISGGSFTAATDFFSSLIGLNKGGQ